MSVAPGTYIATALWKIITNTFKHPTSSSTIEVENTDFVEEVGGAVLQSSTYSFRRPMRDATRTKLHLEKPRSKSISISPTFKLVFLSVLGITVLAGAAQVAMAIAWPKPTVPQGQVFEAMSFAWKAGIGAIFGLLGGKAT